jgi:YidC/Oxa1 family membrane protein insertase
LERRVFLALFLSFLVYFTYQTFFPPKAAPKPGAVAAGSFAATELVPAPATQPTAQAPAESNSGGTPLVAESNEREVVVETPHVTAVFTNRGGRLKSWTLKGYRDRQNERLDLVASELAGSQPLPLSLQVSDAATTSVLNSALYTVTREPAEGLPASGPVLLTFEYKGGDGLAVTKSVEVDTGTFLMHVKASVSRGAALPTTLVWGPGPGDSDSQTTRGAVKPEALYSVNRRAERKQAAAIAQEPSRENTFDFVGIDDHYFGIFAVKPGNIRVTYTPLTIPPAADSKDPARDYMGFSLGLPQDRALTLYAGPKDYSTLVAIDEQLRNAIDFGWFRILVEPLLKSLNWINQYVGNYGWTILILTLLINVILFPLNHKSVVSMRKMQEIQPESKAIQERYAKLKATDPAKQKMNQELMALYRENGVNPASGCIPILLTLPVFLAFYALLSTAIELRGAPFIGWIHDLSLPDPFYVMPVLVGASQVLQQWLTPQAGVDPAQQRMMMIMPVVLIFVFVSTPAGALIYWLVGNIWRIGQMQLTNYIHPPKVHVVRPPAERRVKRAGSGKTDAATGEN